MSDAIWVALILAFTLVVMTVIVSYTWWKIDAEVPREEPEHAPIAEVLPLRPTAETMPQYEYSKTEVSQPTQGDIKDVLKDSPLPWDPNNMPGKRVYNPQPGSTHAPPTCECHKRPIKPGQTVMFWPLPTGGTKVFCLKEDL